jgi:hypothetical protein
MYLDNFDVRLTSVFSRRLGGIHIFVSKVYVGVFKRQC